MTNPIQYITEEIQGQLLLNNVEGVYLPLYIITDSGEELTEDYLSALSPLEGLATPYRSVEMGKDVALLSRWQIHDWKREYHVPSSEYKIKLHLHHYINPYQKIGKDYAPVHLRILEGDELTIQKTAEYLSAYERLLQFYRLRTAEVEMHHAAAKDIQKKMKRMKDKTSDKYTALHTEWSEQLVEGDVLKACLNRGDFNSDPIVAAHQDGHLFKSGMVCFGYGLELQDICQALLKVVTDASSTSNIIDPMMVLQHIDFGSRLGRMDEPIVEFTFRKLGVTDEDIEGCRDLIKQMEAHRLEIEAEAQMIRAKYEQVLELSKERLSNKAQSIKAANKWQQWRDMPPHKQYVEGLVLSTTEQQQSFMSELSPLLEEKKELNARLSKLKTELHTWLNYTYFIEQQDWNISAGQFVHSKEAVDSAFDRYNNGEASMAAKELAALMMGAMVSSGRSEAEAAERAVSLAGLLESKTSRGVSSLAWLLALVVRTRDEHLKLVPFDKNKVEDLAAHFQNLPFKIAVQVFRFFLTVVPSLQNASSTSSNSKTPFNLLRMKSASTN